MNKKYTKILLNVFKTINNCMLIKKTKLFY